MHPAWIKARQLLLEGAAQRLKPAVRSHLRAWGYAATRFIQPAGTWLHNWGTKCIP